MRKECYLIVAILIGFIWCHDGLCAPDKVALVIGNKDYQDAPLVTPVNDADDLSEVLNRLGFDVIKKTNLTHQEMERSIREFGQKIEPGGVALFYYSGHGAQINGTNYLLPVGQTIYGAEEIKFKSVQADLVLAKMESAGSKVNIIILDACRNNPSRGFRTVNQGLAAMDAKGAFIAYATAPGSTAFDNPRERNGLYTKNLLKTLDVPGLTIEELFRKVGYKVSKESDEKQIPWTASGLYGENPFYFIPPNSINPQDSLNHNDTSIMNENKENRGRLGVIIGDVDESFTQGLGIAKEKNILVFEVVPDSPAGKAGLKEGDIIFSFNGIELADTGDLLNRIANTPPGSTVMLNIIRDARFQKISVVFF